MGISLPCCVPLFAESETYTFRPAMLRRACIILLNASCCAPSSAPGRIELCRPRCDRVCWLCGGDQDIHGRLGPGVSASEPLVRAQRHHQRHRYRVSDPFWGGHVTASVRTQRDKGFDWCIVLRLVGSAGGSRMRDRRPR